MTEIISISIGLLALSVLCGSAHGAEFPSPIVKCHKADEKCIAEQGHKFLKAHPNGIPELGIPILEPFEVGTISILGNQQASANVDLVLTDARIYNFTKMQIIDTKFLVEDTAKPMRVTQTTFNPQITIRSKYKVSGNVIFFPINGAGDFELVLTNVTTKSKFFIKSEERNGKIYLVIYDQKNVSKFDSAKVHMKNLFNGDKALSENIHKVINDNWRLFIDDIQPKLNEAVARAIAQTLTNLFRGIPYEDYFLPDKTN